MDALFYVLAVLLGVIIVFLSLKSLLKLFKSKSFTGRAEGEIVEVLEDHSVSKGQRYYYYTPVYEFNANGQVVRKKADYNSSDRNKYKVNNKVVIQFNTANPQEFQAEGSTGNVLGQNLLLLVVGGLFVVFGVIKLVEMYL